MILGWEVPATAMMSSPTSWITATPMLPPPALSPSARPLRPSGKNELMLVIDEAKLPPPNPARAAMSTNTPNGVPGCRTKAATIVGTSSSRPLTTDQLRPPNRATANVYGTRSTAPTSVAVDTSRNLPAASTPYSGPMNSTNTENNVHTENPTCSTAIDAHRLRRATRAPVRSQNAGSSGSQWSIQRPRNRPDERGADSCGAVVVTPGLLED